MSNVDMANVDMGANNNNIQQPGEVICDEPIPTDSPQLFHIWCPKKTRKINQSIYYEPNPLGPRNILHPNN
jgi:hypothetical protein